MLHGSNTGLTSGGGNFSRQTCDADNDFDLVVGVPGDDAAGAAHAVAVDILPGSRAA